MDLKKNYKSFRNPFKRSAIWEQAQPSSLICLEMEAIQSEHPDSAMFRNCTNQLFIVHDFLEIVHVLEHHSNHYFSPAMEKQGTEIGF